MGPYGRCHGVKPTPMASRSRKRTLPQVHLAALDEQLAGYAPGRLGVAKGCGDGQSVRPRQRPITLAELCPGCAAVHERPRYGEIVASTQRSQGTPAEH